VNHRFLDVLTQDEMASSNHHQWAGMLDEATWEAFREATGDPACLPKRLNDLLQNPERPWFEMEHIKELNQKIISHKRTRWRGTHTYQNLDRGITRQIKFKDAFNDVRRFFEISDRGIGSILYIKGDPGNKADPSSRPSPPASGNGSEQESVQTHA
jgi:hypothetical protein